MVGLIIFYICNTQQDAHYEDYYYHLLCDVCKALNTLMCNFL
jgi:hypothetical protein